MQTLWANKAKQRLQFDSFSVGNYPEYHSIEVEAIDWASEVYYGRQSFASKNLLGKIILLS